MELKAIIPHLNEFQGRLWSLFVYFLVAFLLGGASAQAKTLVISDIDDTLKVSHILSKAGSVSSAFDDDSRFVGMAEIFNALRKEHQDIEFHYVSLAPEFLMSRKHQEFLQENGFPVTGLHMNPGITQDPELKQKVIRRLLSNKNPDLVIYFGDNGQFDAVVYNQMQQEFPRIPLVTYIREAYSSKGESQHPTMAGQIGFVTSVEVALDLIQKNLLSETIYPQIENLVLKRLLRDGTNERFGEMVFPGWQDCRDFKWQWEVENPSPALNFIKRAISKKCQNQSR